MLIPFNFIRPSSITTFEKLPQFHFRLWRLFRRVTSTYILLQMSTNLSGFIFTNEHKHRRTYYIIYNGEYSKYIKNY